jgi:short-subunit dehydrogenase
VKTFWRAAALAGGGALAAAAVAKHLRRPKLNLAGKVVLITGGSRGFGLALASRFGRMGCRLALCARDPEELERAAARLSSHASEVKVFPCDLSRAEEIPQLIERVVREMGDLNGLVNNAGLIQVGPAQAMIPEDYDDAMKLMFWAPLHCIDAALPHFRRQGGGFVVNVASIGGKVSVPHLLPYCCAKFALAGLSEGLTHELAGENIQVLTVAPGLMRTGSHIRASFRGDHHREYNWFALSGNAPVLSMEPDKAARKVVDALRNGRREIILTLPANILARLHGLAPDLMGQALTIACAALPHWKGLATGRSEGASIQAEHRSGLTGRMTDLAGRNAVQRYQNLAPAPL